MAAATLAALPYREIWVVDFEFSALPGERPDPVCLVAWELRSGRKIKLWQDQFGPAPPYPIDASVVFVAYYASAELGCHRVLGWPMPARILDLFVEFRDRTNGLPTSNGAGLIGALAYFGLDSIGAVDKQEMRALVLRGDPWTGEERAAILDYCDGDVAALARLLPAMLPRLDLPHALVRGRYMAAVAAMEHAGIPISVPRLDTLRRHWAAIQDRLIADIDADYGVYDGRTFKVDRFEAFLIRAGIPWGRTETGRLELNDGAFRQAAKAHPIISPLRELRSALGEMRLSDLAVGEDGRNRTLLSPFRSRTGRNQPSNSKYIFGPSVWLRGLIQPPPGHGLAYIDWSQQEFGIAAALSGDAATCREETRDRALKTRLPLLVRTAMYALRGGFLVRPLLISLALGLTGMILSSLEENYPVVSAWVPHALFPSRADPQIAQIMLAAIAGSIMTVVSIVFAILLMTLTLASMQFSPRILVSFVRDRVTQWTLGVFLELSSIAWPHCPRHAAYRSPSLRLRVLPARWSLRSRPLSV